MTVGIFRPEDLEGITVTVVYPDGMPSVDKHGVDCRITSHRPSSVAELERRIHADVEALLARPPTWPERDLGAPPPDLVAHLGGAGFPPNCARSCPNCPEVLAAEEAQTTVTATDSSAPPSARIDPKPAQKRGP